jgi:hypothetical protein
VSDDRRRRRLYFGLLLLLEVLVFGYLVVTRRLPKGHDTLSVYLLQYNFLAQAGSDGGVLWMPGLAHGLVSTWFANLQSGLLQNVLLLAGGVPEGTPMLPVFYAGLFLEELLLLLGVWRLGGRFYRTPEAQFFVGLAALGSSLWIDNVYWNHRLIYGVPLMISLVLGVLETGSRWKLFLALGFAGLQSLGNAPYIPMLSMAATGLFVATYVVLQRKPLRLALTRLRPRPSDAAWIAAMALVAAGILLAMTRGLGSMTHYHPGRNPDGSVSLDAFLTYPGSANPLRYVDLILGVTPSTDYSLYVGLFTLVLAIHAFVQRPGRNVAALAISLLLLLLFSTGYLSWVGMAAYYGVPPMHFFRYVSLAAPLVKLFVILLAGFGMDAFARPGSGRSIAFARTGVALLGLIFLWLSMAVLPGRPDALTAFLRVVREGLAIRNDAPAGPYVVAAFVVSVAAAGVFLFRRRPENARVLVPLLLFLHGADLYRWRLQVLREESVPLDDALYAMQKVRPLTYIARRTPGDEDNDRARAFGRAVLDANASRATYDYVDPFVGRDAVWSRYYVTQWSPPVDLLLRARAGRPLRPDGEIPPPLGTLSETYSKIVGARLDKLQVFSAAHPAADADIARLMNRPEFRGDLLFVSAGAPEAPPPDLSKDERLPAVPKVLEFGASRLRVEVETPAEAWLAYADAWHENWTATVDGAPTPVERANLAYKAVRLHPGKNVVEFRFRAPLRAACGVLVALLSLGCCVLLTVWTLRALGVPVAGPDLDHPGSTP